MVQEEKIIKQHDSGRNPFQMPDGYFENFTDRLMARIAEEEKKEPERVVAKTISMTPWRKMMRYAAAVVVVAGCLGGGALLYNRLQTADSLLVADAMDFTWDDETLDDALDYEMVDSKQIAYYLTEAY